MVELYEENIEDWFMKERDNVSLTEYLCERVILKNDDKSKFMHYYYRKVVPIRPGPVTKLLGHSTGLICFDFRRYSR